MASFGKKGFIKTERSLSLEATPPQLELPEMEVVDESRRNQWLLPEEAVSQAEDAAELLIQFLPKEAQSLIQEARQSRGVPLWHMLLGYVMRSADRAELFSPTILPVWESGGRADTPRPCRSCGELFQSRFPEAAFCCNACACEKLSVRGHSDGCPAVEFQKGVTRG